MSRASAALPARHHALDGLRAVMMLLGLVLHAGASYVAAPLGEAWPYQDAETFSGFDLVVFYIHVFRMPIFYVIAGFFAALLYIRRGADGLARNRIVRVAIPFALAWIVLLPLTRPAFTFATAAQTGTLADGWTAVTSELTTFAFIRDTTMHLWFLYYLLMFYAVVLLGGPLLLRLPTAFRARTTALFGAALRSRLRPLYFAVPTIGTLLVMPVGALQTSTSFIPDWHTFLAYLVFFAFGWLLYERRDELGSFQQYAWTQVILATLLVPLNVAAATRGLNALPDPAMSDVVVTAVTGGIMVWLLVFGITGLFLRYLDQPSPRVRYIVDSSYWLYLVHLPFAIWIPGVMTHLQWPAVVKFSVVLMVMTPILLLSYDVLVRQTAIGALLNGRRYPRGLPKFDEHGHPTLAVSAITGEKVLSSSVHSEKAP